jgi:pimeloyl-ACP methyl ester carboxylesterase
MVARNAEEPRRSRTSSGGIDRNRRAILRAAAWTIAGTSLDVLGCTTGQPGRARLTAASTIRPAARNASFAAMRQIDVGALSVGYADVGHVNGPVVVLLHGWPYDIHSYADVVPLLVTAGYRVIVPYLRGYGSTRFLSSDTFRNGQQSVFAVDTIALMDALNIKRATVAGFDWGARTADIIAALWPERCTALVSVSGYLITNLEASRQPLAPQAEWEWWYQYYFGTERGRVGYDKNRRDFAKLIWKNASPKWNFSDATFDRTAASFDNPDHVDIVIHNYRWRLGMAPGEKRYEDMERRLSSNPVIRVPTVTIASDFDGAAADGRAYAKQFTGKHTHRVLEGIGHNVPQEAPRAFADAVMDVAG